MNYKNNFLTIDSVKSKNDRTSVNSSLNNLILGPEIGHSTTPPFEALSWNSWKTKSTNKKGMSYFEYYPEPIVIDFYLQDEQECDAVGFWPARNSLGNSIREFSITVAKDEDSLLYEKPIYKTAFERNPHNLEIFTFDKKIGKIIRITIYSNFSHLNIKSTRVSLREFVILNDSNMLQEAIFNAKSNHCTYDFLTDILKDKFTQQEQFTLSIRPEFSLDAYWKPQSSYNDFLQMRGFSSGGQQLRHIDLSKWADKIYVYHFLKENGIKGMPIVYFSYYIDDAIAKLKQLYSEGMHSFVIKVSHMGYGHGIYRVKDGYFINSDEFHKGTSKVGKKIDFDYLHSRIKNNWHNQQFGDEWACNIIPPGVIIEELIDNPLEIKIPCIFGEPVAVILQLPGFPSFNLEGKAMQDNSPSLPHWWREALFKAKEVAKLVKADHVRIDLFYHKNRVIVSEITWNPADEPEIFQNEIAQRLNQGYSLRQKYLKNTRWEYNR